MNGALARTSSSVRVARERYYVGGTFAVEHRPSSGEVRTTAVVLLPPMGYEDTSAYRPCRVLADVLARAGFVVLRLDWPWLGDGGLDDRAPDLVPRAVEAVDTACTALRDRGFPRVAALGIRAGGLVAMACTGFDEAVLWAAPTSGRAYLREERIFEQMAAASRPSAGPSDPTADEPDGVEAGGFFYSAGTVQALEGMDAPALAGSVRWTRALAIGRDGSAPPGAVVEALERGGTTVSSQEGRGLGDLLDDPYRARLDAPIRDAIVAWLSEMPGRMPHPAHRGDAALRLDVGTERPWVVAGGAGELSGVICEPEAGIVPGQSWTIFYNAGGVRRSGPNRLWTAAARALARDGRPSLRIDVRDVGDSDGTDEPYGHLEAMYAEASIDDAVRAYDWAVARGASSIDVVGLCSGAFMGIQVAARRPVRRALLFNGLAFVWDARARGASVARHVRASLFDLERWKLLLTGRIDLRAVSSALLQRTLASASGVLRRAHGAARIDPVDAILRRVAAAGTELRLVCSENDPSIEYLSRHTAPEHRPDVTTIAAADHTIRPLRAHPRVVALVTGRE